jgi:WD40 repeat protein
VTKPAYAIGGPTIVHEPARARRSTWLAAALLAACGGSLGAPADPPELSMTRPVSRGALSYAVAFAPGPQPRLVAVELGVAFELVVRSIDGAGAVRERARVPLGPPDWDVSDLAIVPGGRAALVASAAGTVRAIDLDTARVTATWHLGAAATSVAASADLVATGSATGVVCLRRLRDGALLQCLVAHTAAVSGLDFDPAGRRLASSSWDGRVAVWSAPQLAAVSELDARGSANALAFAPDGRDVAIAVSGAPPRRSPQMASRERTRGSAADPEARVLVWRPGRPGARAMRGHGGPVVAVAWTDARRVLSASWDRTVRLWDARTGIELARVSGFSHLLRDVAAGGRWAAASAWAATGDDLATVLLALRHPP